MGTASMRSETRPGVDLSRYDAAAHDPGAGWVTRLIWYWINALLFNSWLCPLYAPKRRVLRWFSAAIGTGVVIKPRVNIKYPWRLSVGDHTWIGEGVWIDNLAAVDIGAHCCLSQGVYICTGNHDWSDPRFALRVAPVSIVAHAWVGAFSIIAPGVSLAEGTVTTAGSVVTADTEAWTVYAGNPARPIRKRDVRDRR